MKLSAIKKELSSLEKIVFILPNGTYVPEHFHVTEIGLITKNLLTAAEKFEMKLLLTFNYGMLMILNTV